MDDAGARSQIPSLVGAVVVAVVLLFFAGLLALLPNAALGGIVANAVLRLIEVESEDVVGFGAVSSGSRPSAWLSVLLVGALLAVVIAFLLATIDVVRRAAAPRTAVLTATAATGRWLRRRVRRRRRLRRRRG